MNPNNDGDLFSVTLPANLIAQIDAQVGAGFVDREDFLRAAVRHYLEHLQTSTQANTDTLG